MPEYRSVSGSVAEDLFIELFSEAFGAEKAGYLYSQYHFFDIYQNSRYADFVLENGSRRVAFEIDDEASHNKSLIASGKFYDDLLKQNSMIYLGWEVYRWAVRQMQQQREAVKDELRLFLGNHPQFKEIEDYLPTQRAKALDWADLELKQHQLAALRALEEMRANNETITLLYHATGTGKTVTAVMDAKRCAGRTLFLAHTQELVNQAAETFGRLWPEVSIGLFMEAEKQPGAFVVCGSVQSVALHLDSFKDNDFAYLIVDEAHHAAADTYQKVLAYFKPVFTLGLTATPERTDDNKVILEIFKNTAHKLDIQTAVEIGELVPIRCIRIHTNIDLTKVRFNSVQYNIRDLESKIYVPERNRLIVDTWLQMCRGRRTVIFCASVRHAEQIAELFRAAGVRAAAVSGGMKNTERKEFQARFVERQIEVLCACDLLNEGWDCPEIEVLFMARPTMSKVLYTQQLGRGMRLFEGKESLMVFDFVDNASQYNMPQSLHRLFKLKDYRPGQLAVAPAGQKTAEAELYARGEKPEALLDWPVNATDYELVDIFNWQEEAEGMISQMELVRRYDLSVEEKGKYMHTPISVNKLAQTVLNIVQNDNVADICCGCGSFLNMAVLAKPNARYYGYEINEKNKLIADIRAELLDADISINLANVFSLGEDKTSPRFDKIFSNYPFGIKYRNLDNGEKIFADLSQKIPGLSKGISSDWLFNTLIYNLLSDNGKAIGIMTNGSTCNSIDELIRKYFVEQGMIEAVIALPPKMFSYTNIATTMIILSKGNKAVRMVDATNICQQGRRFNEFSEDDIQRICSALQADSEISRLVDADKLRINNYALNLSRYLEQNYTLEDAIVFGDIIKSISRGAPCTASQLDEMAAKGETNMQYLMLANINDGIIDDNLPYLASIEPKFEKYCLKK